MKPIDLRAWIDAHREQLRPPVGNARVFDDGDFIIMVVGGPNRRTDFHLDPGDELFFQLEGDIELDVVDGEGRRTIPIPQGSMLLLPAGVPHCPRRPEATVGLVVERRRQPGERDGLRWYCDRCNAVVHEAWFEMTDITTQIRDAITALRADRQARTCECGTTIEV